MEESLTYKYVLCNGQLVNSWFRGIHWMVRGRGVEGSGGIVALVGMLGQHHSLMSRKWPRWLEAMFCSQPCAFSARSRKFAPALHTRASHLVNCLQNSVALALTLSQSLRSRARKTARPRASRDASRMADCARDSERQAKTTVAPRERS